MLENLASHVALFAALSALLYTGFLLVTKEKRQRTAALRVTTRD